MSDDSNETTTTIVRPTLDGDYRTVRVPTDPRNRLERARERAKSTGKSADSAEFLEQERANWE
ncbi:hypothetical protein [Natrarchaeobaculum aegyptiacum]|uniref:Uncharacterized protein n=1 Tax=Natrarchaeobaculum aegyptiacum TaxID=745377 RepID=A0A2Z2HRQ0_9EURY|nr:hypothetical protein [Natrarchaeobaculum aegyptiacum]ARS89851.1 hypothetical protein B1756_08955 [Natrarchaeobaculum aegyptiacum]